MGFTLVGHDEDDALEIGLQGRLNRLLDLERREPRRAGKVQHGKHQRDGPESHLRAFGNVAVSNVSVVR